MSLPTRRERWPSRFAYVVASVSAMIGLGTFLRLPTLVAEFGGVTFFVPYYFLTLVVGYTMFTLESATGEIYRSGVIAFFHYVYKDFIGFGVLQLVANILSCGYYNIILGWFLLYTIRSSYSPWNYNTQAYFDEYILNVNDRAVITVANILSCSIIWVVVFISIYKGVCHTTKIVYVTLPFPILMMVMLFVRAITLENGLSSFKDNFYVDVDELLGPRIWIEALGQIMISTSMGFGVAAAYGSYRIKDGFVMEDAFIVHVIKILVELLSWITMGCITGHQGWSEDQLSEFDGFQVAFVLYPNIAQNLAFPYIWNFLFFMFLLILGIDCSHASVEGIVTCLVDSKRFANYSRTSITLMTVLTGVFASVVMHFNLHIVSACDYFLTNVWFILGALGEALVLSLFYNVGFVYSKLGYWPVAMAHISWVISPVISTILFVATGKHLIAILIGIFTWLFGTLVSMQTSPYTGTFRSKLYILFLYQGKLFQHHYNETLKMDERQTWFKFNTLWYICLKFVSVPLLIIAVTASFISVFYIPVIKVNSAIFATTGLIFVLLAILIIFLPRYIPNIYDSLAPIEQQPEILHIDEWMRFWLAKEKRILKNI